MSRLYLHTSSCNSRLVDQMVRICQPTTKQIDQAGSGGQHVFSPQIIHVTTQSHIGLKCQIWKFQMKRNPTFPWLSHGRKLKPSFELAIAGPAHAKWIPHWDHMGKQNHGILRQESPSNIHMIIIIVSDPKRIFTVHSFVWGDRCPGKHLKKNLW